MSLAGLPVGEPVDEGNMQDVPRKGEYGGQFVSLSPINPDLDVQELYNCSHGTEEKELVWTYMGYGPFKNENSMCVWLQENAESSDPIFFTVHQKPSGRRVGMVSFLNLAPDVRRLEIGHIWYGLEAQRTKVNTEAVYLMLNEAFDRLRYRRVEWKCDSLNERSRSAANRLGFKFEGIFRYHLIVKGRNRDTAWYSMLNSEWPPIKKNLETWLYKNSDGKSVSLSKLKAEANHKSPDS